MNRGDHLVVDAGDEAAFAGFWEAAREGRLVLPECDDCGKIHWHPRAICPFCLSSSITWTPSRGRGLIYASTVFRKAEADIVIAYVELDEGPRLLTHIMTERPASICIGQRVEVVFPPANEIDAGRFPIFQPVALP